jgi:CO/xanthine dehydrogenase Mo-binding subunit
MHGGEPGSLVTAQLAGWEKPGLEEGFGGASNNFEPVYSDIPNRLVKFIYLGPASHRQGPLRIRVGSMRGVGSPDNIYVTETFMDELAAAAGADPLEFRLKHKPTPRMVKVFEACAERFGWQPRPAHSKPARGDIATGRGVAALGGPRDTNVVGMFEVAVNRKTGAVQVKRAVVAQDCGLVVNPATVTDQVEGGILMSIGRGLWEEVSFDRSRITSVDWSKYRIMKFTDMPESVEIILLDRQDQPPLRVGEPASEVVWPALSNAIYDAVGVRLRDMPFSPERVLMALSRPRQAAL